MYDPTLPRKNITFSISGSKDNREKAVELLKKLTEDKQDYGGDFGQRAFVRGGEFGIKFNLEEY